MQTFPIFTVVGLLVGASIGVAVPTRPNVLVILADDLGFSDLGCYGGEIQTPTLDRLAEGGLRFSQFYNTAKCHSSRISLLTGQYPLQAGNTSLSRGVTFAELLGRAGYFTAMCGKWHLDKEPTDFGFDRYFGHLSGATDYFRGNETYRLNGARWKVPDKGFYTTTAISDFALDFLGEAREDPDRPWLLYLAYNAPHSPLQALEEDYRRYEHTYDAGWQAVRAARVAKQRRLGLFPESSPASPKPDHLPEWESVSDDQQVWERRRMATYAAMVDRMDREIGRVVADLEAAGELENTLIFFASDNGASPYERTRGRNRDPWDTSLPRFHWNTGTAWAWVSNTPFRYYKQQQYEGGIASPLIVHWPANTGITPGAVTGTVGHLIDVVPTLLEVTGTRYPTSWHGRDLNPFSGVSLSAALSGEVAPAERELYFLFDQDRGLRDGDLKLVSFRGAPWQLFDLRVDRNETRDLAAERPRDRGRLVRRWHDLAEQVDCAPQRLRKPVAKTGSPPRHPEWTRYEQ